MDDNLPIPTQLTGYRRKRIQTPLVFPDGIGINYAATTGSVGSPAPSLQLDSGYASAETHSQGSNFGGIIPHSHNVTCTLPPRHGAPWNEQQFSEYGGENLIVEGQIIVLRHLRPNIGTDDLKSLLYNIGFTAPFTIKPLQNGSTSLEFSHANVATAALSILQHRAGSLFLKFPEIVDLTTTIQADVIDLTGSEHDEGIDDAQNEGASQVEDMDDSLYGDMSVYDELDMQSSDSDASMVSAGSRSKPSDMSPSHEHRDAAMSKNTGETDLLTNGNHALSDFPSTPRPRARPSITNSSPSRDKVPLFTRGPTYETENNDPLIQTVRLPPAAHNRARRVLLPKDKELPIMTVSMRADLQFFHRTARHRISRYSIPNNLQELRHAGDAVMIGDVAAIGYLSSPCQVSLVHSKEGHSPVLTELKEKPHIAQSTPGVPIKSGVNCLAARKSTANTVQFFTGGYDKTIRLWSVTTPDLVTRTDRLTTLPTIPHALAFKDRILLVGTSKKILTLDLDHLSAKPMAAQLSNTVHQIHVHKQAPNVIILEVDSLDMQIQIFDDRGKRGLNRTPDCFFGVRCEGSKTLRSGCRGDSEFSLFAKGFPDGTVRLWDYRNSKHPVVTKTFQNMGTVTHTVFMDSGKILCYNGDNLLFVDSRGT